MVRVEDLKPGDSILDLMGETVIRHDGPGQSAWGPSSLERFMDAVNGKISLAAWVANVVGRVEIELAYNRGEELPEDAHIQSASTESR